MYDVTGHCDMNYMRSKDARKTVSVNVLGQKLEFDSCNKAVLSAKTQTNTTTNKTNKTQTSKQECYLQNDLVQTFFINGRPISYSFNKPY